MRASLVRLEWENETRTIASLYFKPDKPYYFTAGQYASLTIPHDSPDQRGLTRTMTFTSSPSDELLRFTMRLGHENTSSYKQAVKNMAPGATATITDAMGDLVLPLDEHIPLVFVAGGVGVASYISMIRWLIEQQDGRHITLLYAVRDTRDIIFQTDFDRYHAVGNLKKMLFTTDNKAAQHPWQGAVHTSRLTSSDIVEVLRPDSQVYISGTESMVEQLRHELQHEHGIPQYRIVFDYFDGYSAVI